MSPFYRRLEQGGGYHVAFRVSTRQDLEKPLAALRPFRHALPSYAPGSQYGDGRTERQMLFKCPGDVNVATQNHEALHAVVVRLSQTKVVACPSSHPDFDSLLGHCASTMCQHLGIFHQASRRIEKKSKQCLFAQDIQRLCVCVCVRVSFARIESGRSVPPAERAPKLANDPRPVWSASSTSASWTRSPLSCNLAAVLHSTRFKNLFSINESQHVPQATPNQYLCYLTPQKWLPLALWQSGQQDNMNVASSWGQSLVSSSQRQSYAFELVELEWTILLNCGGCVSLPFMRNTSKTKRSRLVVLDGRVSSRLVFYSGLSQLDNVRNSDPCAKEAR